MMNKPFLYKFGVKLLGHFYKWYYNPQIIGKKNLEIDGPYIIASNHIHLFDQCNILISTDKFITYMAKKEYFDSKKTRWFFKGVGCIPVNRSKKDDSAVKSALKVLNEKGYIGIFPEGTRNKLKDEKIDEIYNKYFKKYEYLEYIKKIKNNDFFTSQLNKIIDMYENKEIDLDEFFNSLDNVDSYLKNKLSIKEYYDSLMLDLKYGAVSMAKKTESFIIPVVVCGEYKFKSNNLVIKIGNALDVSNMSLEEANLILRKKMINLIKEVKENE